MWIIKLAWKNLWRNRSRTLISVAAVFFCSVTIHYRRKFETGSV